MGRGRWIRALAAAGTLLLPLAGVPLILALALQHPGLGWQDLQAGDLSADALLDVLAGAAIVFWAMVAWAVIWQGAALARGVLHPPPSPGLHRVVHVLLSTMFMLTTHHPSPGAAAGVLSVATAPVAFTHALTLTAHQGGHPPSPATTRTGHVSGPATSPAPGHESGNRGDVVLGAVMGLLAGAVLRELGRLRRRQWRYRRPGRVITATPPDLATAEKGVTLAGRTSAADIDDLDAALRDLAARLAQAGQDLPDLLAVRMTPELIELVHASPAHTDQGGLPVPWPWSLESATGRWHLSRAIIPSFPRARADGGPYPALVSFGHTGDGDCWLINLQHLGVLTLRGDVTTGRDLIRSQAAELALHPWSHHLRITVAGLGEELTGLSPQLEHNPDPAAVLTRIRADLTALIPSSNRPAGPGAGLQDVAANRVLRVVFADTTTLSAATRQVLHNLRRVPDGILARAGIALVVLDPDSDPAGAARAASVPARLTGRHTGDPVPDATVGAHDVLVTGDGQVQIPQLGLRLTAQGLTGPAAAQLVRLLSLHRDTHDQPTPSAPGLMPWDALSDAAGAPLSDLTEPNLTHPQPATGTPQPFVQRDLASAGAPPQGRAAGTATQPGPPPAPAGRHTSTTPATGDEETARRHDEIAAAGGLSILDDPASPDPAAARTADLLRLTATTAPDITALAPRVRSHIRDVVRDRDPALDTDLDDWWDPHTLRPRLSVLGPVLVRAHGDLPPDKPREPWHTEVVTYLAFHSRGVTPEQFGADLWPDDPDVAGKPKIRQAIRIVRAWLGTDPTTGTLHIPKARTSTGTGLYRIDGLLTDAGLFRRLRLRALTLGPDGITDLQSALSLVTGPPLDQRRPDGYSWLVDTPLGHQFSAMVIDVAHLAATHHLAAGHPDLAAAAAAVALTAGSTDDITLLDLVAAADAQHHHAEAGAWVRQILTNHDTDTEVDLPPRTAAVLHRRQWLPAESA